MFLKNKFIIPFIQSIKEFEVARTGQPRMTGIWVSGLAPDSVSRTTKFIGNMNSATLIKTSSTIPLRGSSGAVR